ncbi:putative Exopolysaccharide biosynthesis related tyrosine-protein kinase [Nitrospira sp. KM1]|uniref:CpsD/CapB family tyrosine-protein kinase n=1 Tax=Nitrospira sp. KM1 TaxID=1936990 RepID=UPI0013A751BA|nr:CpsD/CapB family tyrosine-protein kinase [Nitrospira sp. KM1]BCA57137.1 putative Exopolysaccharide biosynthesis related tyrosine-protein kinase [Nitrospira sp. KM1]
MEDLQHAMERYREQGGGSPSRGPGGTRLKEVPPPIIYSRTKVIDCPEHVLRRKRIVAGFDRGPFVEGYNLLRTQVLHRLRENNWNVLGITSPRQSEGKTLTAVNLAVTLAMEVTQTVLLVDADLRKPGVDELFGLTDLPGLADVLLDEKPVDEALVHPGIGRFVILPAGRSIPRSAETLTTPRMSALVSDLKHRYESRILIFDLPPVLTSADVLAFGPSLDAVLIVASEGITRRADLEEAIHRLKGAVPILGTVLNQVGRGDPRSVKAHAKKPITF